jgi:glutamate decarboxylase
MENCRDNMIVLKEGLEKMGRFNIVSKDNGVPLVAFTLKDHTNFDEFQISDLLRRFGWIVPAYSMPPDAQHITVLRVVIREDFSRTLAERLVADVEKVLHELDTLAARIRMISSSSNVTVTEEVVKNNGQVVATKKSALETQREITAVWKKFVLERKKLNDKMNGVC